MVDSHSQQSPATPAWLIPLAWLILGFALLAGIWSRFVGLGVWNLSLDEYYFMSSVQFILDKGIPEFPCGGYYVRGLLQQYITAPLLYLTGDPELAGRLPTAVANLLTAPVIYFIARHVVSKPVALLTTALFLISLWEIEFARFARMYAFFQLIFALQVLWLLQWRAGRPEAFWRLPLTALVAVLVHEGAVFVLMLCFIPLILAPLEARTLPRTPRWYWPFVGLATVVTLAFQLVDMRSFGAPSRTPEDFKRPPSDSRIDLPDLQTGTLMNNLDSPLALLGLALVAAGGAWLIWRLIRDYRERLIDWRAAAVISAAILLCLLHLFMLATVTVFLFMLLGYFTAIRRASFIAYVAGVAAMAVGWLLILQSPVPLVNYPSFFWGFVNTYLTAIPIETIWIVAGIGIVSLIGLIHQLSMPMRHSAEADSHKGQALKILLFVFLGCLTVFCLLNTRFTFTRYSFHLYPLMLLFIVISIHWLALQIGKLASDRTGTIYAFALLTGLGGYVLSSEHYGWRHLVFVDHAEYSLRSAYPLFTEFHYYQRDDFETVGQKVAELAAPEDVVISSSPAADFYIPNISYIFHTRDDIRYLETISCRGTEHLWTGIPMLSRYEEVEALVESGTRVWFVTGENSNGRKDLVDAVVSAWPESRLVYESIDGSDRLYEIRSAR
ncbi:glycosyltransferase family 39 protein [Allohahella marinimesophila]|uniref:Glycosyltransferase RgtA/B/C/D-like domain-containing protein n=1 Tax=Allohahella marinimesophila TaxID=1054972 RepID=A0ABP7PF31_9GAMM